MNRIRRQDQLRALGRAVEEWGSGAGGSSRRPELPWRRTRDPWAVLVSEIMTQQTQVGRVVPIYSRFLERFPTPAACAASPLGDVLRAWRGLGYNRRARNLHLAAGAIVTAHGGCVPDELGALEALPGIGAYTARAVLAFGFRRDVGVVEANTGRVLARAVAGRPLRRTEAQELVDAMVPPGRGWHFGQALLDLGATHCRSTAPECGSCPIRRRCRWSASGRSFPDPARRSAGVSRPQSRFEGSDRQGRGRLIDALRDRPLSEDDVAGLVGWSPRTGRPARVVAGLLAEGLVVRDGGGLIRLPP